MNTGKTLSAEEIEALSKRPIDLSDIPEITDEQVQELCPKKWRLTKLAVSACIDTDTL